MGASDDEADDLLADDYPVPVGVDPVKAMGTAIAIVNSSNSTSTTTTNSSSSWTRKRRAKKLAIKLARKVTTEVVTTTQSTSEARTNIRCEAVVLKVDRLIPDEVYKQMQNDAIVSAKSKKALEWFRNKKLWDVRKKMQCPGYEGDFGIPRPAEEDVNGLRVDSAYAKNASETEAMARALQTAVMNGDDKLAILQLAYCKPGVYFGGAACTFPITKYTPAVIRGMKVCRRVMKRADEA